MIIKNNRSIFYKHGTVSAPVIIMIVVNVKEGKIAFGVDYGRIIITGEPENIIKNSEKIMKKVEKIDDGLVDLVILIKKNNIRLQ